MHSHRVKGLYESFSGTFYALYVPEMEKLLGGKVSWLLGGRTLGMWWIDGANGITILNEEDIDEIIRVMGNGFTNISDIKTGIVKELFTHIVGDSTSIHSSWDDFHELDRVTLVAVPFSRDGNLNYLRSILCV